MNPTRELLDQANTELVAARKRIAQLEAALKVCHQALIETAHAQDVGASWYTRGADGLYRQVHMWVRKGLDAIKACSSVETDGDGIPDDKREKQPENRGEKR